MSTFDLSRPTYGLHLSYPRHGKDVSQDLGVTEYDPMAGVQRDLATQQSVRQAAAIARRLLPSGAPASAVTRTQQYLTEHPIDELITASSIQITHIANAAGEEEKVRLVCDREAALSKAKSLKLNLVKMGGKDDTAFCRIRDERARILKLVESELQEANPTPQQTEKKKNVIQHQFRDVVDAHFIGWKSKKIVADIKKGHPVKLVIREFQNYESALLKLQEMCRAMQRVAEEGKVPHHFTSITASSTEASISFSPPATGKNSTLIKYPTQKEWDTAHAKMGESCKKSGRLGTYAKTGFLKPRNVGQTTYRVDKFGRRLE